MLSSGSVFSGNVVLAMLLPTVHNPTSPHTLGSLLHHSNSYVYATKTLIPRPPEYRVSNAS